MIWMTLFPGVASACLGSDMFGSLVLGTGADELAEVG